jgi:cell division cycle 14
MLQVQTSHLNCIEIIKERLYWLSDKNPPKNQTNAFFFNIDNDLVYQPFFADFGPLDMGKTYRFITELEKLLQEPSYSKSKFYHHTSVDSAKRTNAACLMGAFQVVILGKTAEEAWEPFSKIQPSLGEYRDAGYTNSPYRCNILDCLRGLEYAIKLKWFDLRSFNLRDYEFYEKVENGDLNWIIPGKFMAFSGPSDKPKDPDGYRRFTPEDYVPIFKKFGVTMVIRLNNKQYDEERFKKNGIKHTDLYFLDGSTPSDEIIERFLKICEQEKGAIAVHCKAGLGRTGSLIAAYAMKHYKFIAPDFIGYIRLCRPGSVLGPQQQFLCDKQAQFQKETHSLPLYKSVAPLVADFHERRERFLADDFERLQIAKNQEMSPMDKKIAKYGDLGQANRLLDAKFKKPSDNSPVESTASTTPEGHKRTPSNGGGSQSGQKTKTSIYQYGAGSSFK